MPGNILFVNGDQQTVVSVTNSTSLTVGTPWSSNNSSSIAYVITPSGISYLNATNSLYTNYKQFQIKVILQSKDSSKVPLLKSLQALALQL